MEKRVSHTTSLYLCFIGSILLNTLTTLAQCGCAHRFETTFPAAVKEAPVVIEGEIKSEMLFFGGAYNDDYKTQKITVYKVLKGDFEAKEVELIEQNISITPRCGEGANLGIFLLYPSTVTASPFEEIPANLKFKPKYAMGVGCNVVNYNQMEYGSDNAEYSTYELYTLADIKEKVYDVAEHEVGYTYKEIAKMPSNSFKPSTAELNKAAKMEELQTVNITSISPTTITAGTFDTLTIKGNGFSAEWKVAFRSADSYDANYVTIPDNHYIVRPNAANDTMYKVLVPCVELRKNITHPSEDFIIASTGKVALKKEGTATLKKSGQTLTIPYAEQTYALTDTSTKIYPIRLARNTPEGDFSFWMHPSIYNNTPAKQLLRQAIEQWRCASGVNFTVVCDTTTTNIPVTSGDHQSTISMISHDAISFAAPYMNGLNAITIRKYDLCKSQQQAVITEADIIFREKPTYNFEDLEWYYTGYSPGNISTGEYDFYTIALHELGHAHLLEHVGDDDELMYLLKIPGHSDVIHTFNPTTDLVAAANIMARSVTDTTSACLRVMQAVSPANCSLPDCADVGCGDAGYPLQAVFQLFPEHCLDNSYYAASTLQGAWYQMVATEVPVVAKDESMGSIVSRQWQIDTDGSLFDNVPCNDLSTLPDTCRSLYWTSPGNKNITLTVTDANGCSASYQETISVQAECTDNLPIITQSRRICNPTIANCGSSDRNIQLRITRLDGLIGSGCYRYFISYHPTDPAVSTAQEVFTDADLQASDNPNEWQLNCLKAGYYRIQMTDEITACQAEQIVFLNNPEPVYPIIDQYYLQADAGCGVCTGSIVLQTVNGNPDLEHYQFAWSVCDPPESCNVVQQNNLCAGAYAVTAFDPSTGCSSTSNLSIDYTVPNNDGIVTGINIDVYPTVYTNNTNVRLSLPAAGEVTVEVFNFNGVLVKKIVDKVFYQQGEFIIPDNTYNLNDGLYLYRLKVCETYKSDIGIKY